MVTMNGDGPTTCFAEGEDLRHRVEQLERQLAASEQRFLAFTERSSDVVALLDSSGVICAVSPAIAHILGYAPADCLGAPLSPLVHPDDQPRIVPLLEALALVPGASASVQLRMRHQNGQWRWMEAIAKNQLAIPHVGGIVLNVHDVTTLHRAEEELRSERDLMSGALYASAAAIVAFSATAQVAYANERAAQLLGLPLADLLGQGDQGGSSPPTPAQRRRSPELDLLFRQVMERGEPIMDMRRSICPPGGEQRLLSLNGVPVRAATGEICSVVISIVDSTEQQLFAQQLSRRQQIEAVGRLAGGVAHDFNNALTVILGACSFLMDEVGQNPTVQHDLEQIQEAGERVSVLTRQLLALSRQQSPMPQPIQLNTSIERLRLMLQRMLGRQIELRLHLAPALDLIHADAHQIDLVLVNLVAHALDSMPQGGTVLIETAEVELDAGSVPGHVLVPGRYAMLAVSDTGEGMAMAAREQIFDPFLASRRPGSSTGLVLWSVQNTALQSGGAIWVASDLGYGSTFKVFLPFAAAADAPPPPAPLAAPIARTVLVVEPDPAALAFARDVLAQAGYHVIGAASAEHARASAALADAVDLLIVDALAPDLAPLLRWLGERWPQVGALYTSGHTRSVLDALAPDLAAQPELLRPFGAAALLTRVRAHCFGDVGVG